MNFPLAVSSSPPDTFRVISPFSARADIARRKEVKFAFPAADVAKLRRMLTCGSRTVAHNESVSTVRSIYFDDLQLSACRANLDGGGQRTKLRLRWYDSVLPGGEFFVEIKWRDNRVTGKHRLEMASERPLGAMTYTEILKTLERSLPREYLPALLVYPQPVLVVEYQREHFHARQGDPRFTIDYQLRFYNQMGQERIAMEFGLPLNDLVVVEAKTPVGGEGRLAELLFPFSARPTRCSKYVYGCRMLGLTNAS